VEWEERKVCGLLKIKEKEINNNFALSLLRSNSLTPTHTHTKIVLFRQRIKINELIR
jgi:hypothetical protein